MNISKHQLKYNIREYYNLQYERCPLPKIVDVCQAKKRGASDLFRPSVDLFCVDIANNIFWPVATQSKRANLLISMCLVYQVGWIDGYGCCIIFIDYYSSVLGNIKAVKNGSQIKGQFSASVAPMNLASVDDFEMVVGSGICIQRMYLQNIGTCQKQNDGVSYPPPSLNQHIILVHREKSGILNSWLSCNMVGGEMSGNSSLSDLCQKCSPSCIMPRKYLKIIFKAI